jgi:hypothetical protein
MVPRDLPGRRPSISQATGVIGMSDVGLSAKTGVAIFIAAVGLAGGIALARGPEMLLPTAAEPGPMSDAPRYFGAPRYAPPPSDFGFHSSDDYEPSRHHHKHSVAKAKPRPAVNSVCVRLCDGFFFPTSTTAGGDAACTAQCPDAPVALYSMPTDKIDDAVSLSGAKYTALPVANRHETSYDATCTCHRDLSASRIADLLRDPTLRKGDLVMTADGFKVFEGANAGAAHPSDFVALARATNVPRDERAALVAMEHSSAGREPRLRGTVTVDDGPRAAAR